MRGCRTGALRAAMRASVTAKRCARVSGSARTRRTASRRRARRRAGSTRGCSRLAQRSEGISGGLRWNMRRRAIQLDGLLNQMRTRRRWRRLYACEPVGWRNTLMARAAARMRRRVRSSSERSQLSVARYSGTLMYSRSAMATGGAKNSQKLAKTRRTCSHTCRSCSLSFGRWRVRTAARRSRLRDRLRRDADIARPVDLSAHYKRGPVRGGRTCLESAGLVRAAH